ncbi:MAG: chitobiase/beta-hexosaminidase C-terminal domain-containing protein, partial [Patescibacteria group bacterium]
MNKGLLFKIAVVFTALSISTNVYASIVEGNLTTGLGNAVEGVVVASPTASPIAGTYTSAQSVTLTASSSTSIHYTINGSDPTCTDTNVYSTSTPVSIKSTKTIRAISCYPNSVSSIIGSYAYSLNIVDGSTENITPSSSNTGEASLPTGATSVKLSNTTSMDVSASVDVVADGKVTVGGIEKTLASFTGGNLTTAVNLSVPISISDQTITVGKAVSMQSGVDGQAMVLTNSDL